MCSRISSGHSAMEFLSAVFVATLLLAWTLGKLPTPWTQQEIHQHVARLDQQVRPAGEKFLQENVQKLGAEVRPAGERFIRENTRKLGEQLPLYSVVSVPDEFNHLNQSLGRAGLSARALPVESERKAGVSQGMCSILSSCEPQALMRQSQEAFDKLRITVGM